MDKHGPTPSVDFVITFSVAPEGSDKAKATQAIEKEYADLLGVLKDAGLEATGRGGAQGTDTVLIFVRATEARVQAEIHRERMSDWLNGVASTRPSPRTPRDFSAEPIHQSERLRLVYAILTSARTGTNVSITSSASAGSTAGLTPLPSPPSFPHVRAIFPPHDLAFNASWLEKWSSRSHIVSIPPEELTSIKDHFGETVALYFAFLRSYFIALVFPAGIGLLFWIAGLAYSAVYGVAIVAWSTIFIESWRLKERELAVQWGTFGVHKVEVQRPEFKGECAVIDPVTGVEEEFFPWWKTLGRQLATIPVLLVFATVLACIISVIYSIETIVGEVYSGPGKRYLTSHANSLTLKVFALNFFVAFGSLLLTSYVYIPFGGFIVPYILSFIPEHSAKFGSGTSFTINSSKLHTQIVAYTLTNQITGAFVELGVPAITRLLTKKVAEVRHGHDKDAVVDDEDEKAFLERVRNEASLPPYNVFADYAEMTLQFGYLTLFSVIWPIAPVWSFVNNFFELRSDAFKLTSQSQRPIPTREASIGPWLEVLGFITWFGALTNASLVYLYRPHLSHTSVTSSLLSSLSGTNLTAVAGPTNGNGTICPTSNMHVAQNSSTSPVASIQATLFSALLVALATEHGYLVARVCVRFILERLSWRGSDADVRIRGATHELRKAYLDEMGLREGPVKLAERSGKLDEAKVVDDAEERVKADGKFWGRQDGGLSEIRRRTKVD
ncbi:hypothetical protein RQP46_010318 [Phenoliferia psychrophenolica]